MDETTFRSGITPTGQPITHSRDEHIAVALNHLELTCAEATEAMMRWRAKQKIHAGLHEWERHQDQICQAVAAIREAMKGSANG